MKKFIHNFIQKLKRKEEIKRLLSLNEGLLRLYQYEIDGIDEELDLISKGIEEGDEPYIGSLLHDKIKCQQKICEVVASMIKLYDELKGLK